MKNNESGRSMVEMLGVLAIIGMLSVGGLWGYSEAVERYKLNRQKAQISAILNSVAAHLTDNRQETNEDLSLIPYFKYKTPALFDDMPIVKSNSEPYEFLKDAFGTYVSIYINKGDNNTTVVKLTGAPLSNGVARFADIDTGVAYCRNVLLAVQPIYQEYPGKITSITLYGNGGKYARLHEEEYDFANMGVGQMINVCEDILTRAANRDIMIYVYFNNSLL